MHPTRNSTARGNDNGTVLLNITGSKTILKTSVLKVETHVNKTWFQLLNDQCSLGILSGVRVCSGNYSAVKRQGFMVTNLNTTIGEFLSRFKRRLPKHAVVLRFASEQNLFTTSPAAPSPQKTSQLSSIAVGRNVQERHSLAATLSHNNAAAPVGSHNLEDERGSFHRVPVFNLPPVTPTLRRNECASPRDSQLIGPSVASVNATESESVRKWLEHQEEDDVLRIRRSQMDIDIESVYNGISDVLEYGEVENKDGETESVVSSASSKTLVLLNKGRRMEEIKSRVKENLENGFSNARLLLVMAEMEELAKKPEVWRIISEQAPLTRQYLAETLLQRRKF